MHRTRNFKIIIDFIKDGDLENVKLHYYDNIKFIYAAIDYDQIDIFNFLILNIEVDSYEEIVFKIIFHNKIDFLDLYIGKISNENFHYGLTKASIEMRTYLENKNKYLFLLEYEYNIDSQFNDNYTRSRFCEIQLMKLVFSFM